MIRAAGVGGLVLLASLVAAGCGLFGITPGALDEFTALSQVAPRPNAATIDSGLVRVQLRTSVGAFARVTMRVAGVVVNLSERTLPAGTDALIIGPDRVDSVLVEGTIFSSPPQVFAARSFFLGRDFQAGDTIVIDLDPVIVPDPNVPDPNQPPPPPPLTVAIAGLDENVVLNAGTLFPISVFVAGQTPAAQLSVFADPDGVPASGNEFLVGTTANVAAQNTIIWDTTDFPSATYTIYAEVQDQGGLLRSAPAAGTVRINVPPLLTFDSPADGLLVTRGKSFIIAWAGQDPDDDDATITIFLDIDTVVNGNELVLKTGILASDLDDRELEVDTSDLPEDVFFVGGTITDGLATRTTYAGRVCVTNRLAGRLELSQLLVGEATTIRGTFIFNDNRETETSFALGTSIDVSTDLNNDGLADLLIGDPLLTLNIGHPKFPDGLTTGAAYYHKQPDGVWPRDMTVEQLRLRLLGGDLNSRTGETVAFLGPRDDPNAFADVAIGAPRQETFQGDIGGVLYVVAGETARTPDPCSPEVFNLFELEPPDGTTSLGIDGENLAHAIARLGDFDVDFFETQGPDSAIGAPSFNNGTGRVGIVHPGLVTQGRFFDNDNFNLMLEIQGENPGDRFGSALADAGLIGCASVPCRAAVLIGAPGALGNAGAAYVVVGDPTALDIGLISVTDLGLDAPGFRLVGEEPGDRVGAAVAGVDFNGDGLVDLVIGAPGAAGGRGRVYVVFNGPELASLLNGQTIPLKQVGASLPGFVLEGIAAGDELGAAVANAGDVDNDEIPELLIGAPRSESQRGTAMLIYGGQSLSGVMSIALLGTCDFQGWQLVGPLPGARLGSSLSGRGDLNGDGRADVGVGAPGNAINEGAVQGEAHLIFR